MLEDGQVYTTEQALLSEDSRCTGSNDLCMQIKSFWSQPEATEEVHIMNLQELISISSNPFSGCPVTN